MNFELVTLDGVKFAAEAYSVVLPTAAGEITVLPGHEPLMSVITPGIITIRREKNTPEHHLEHYATYGGVAEIGNGSLRVLVDEATHGDEIDEAEAQKARDAAVQLRKDAKDQVELDKAEALVHRHGVNLEVAKIRRRIRR